mmetsp:Transcript_1661/g.2174  ORF Transcript_1661/g.2174 Transcript_1661/m.2174 type:complete len:461 (+) Transcript_1661:75-1457(+)
MSFFSGLSPNSSRSLKSLETSSNDTDITWQPGTWIRKPLDSLFLNKYLNLYYHHAIAITDEYIIEVRVVNRERRLIGKECRVIKAFERISDCFVPNCVRNLIEKYCLVTAFDINGQCCVSRIESKKDWEIYKQPKSFIDGIIVVNRALDDVDKPIEYKLTTNNCEVYVNRWWNQQLPSHQMKSTIKWCGLVFLGFILSTYTFTVKEGNSYKAKACEAAKAMFIHVANELENEGARKAQIKALQTAADNITHEVVDQLQQAETKLTEIICSENQDICTDGTIDDTSQGLNAEELREFVKGVKTLWKMKKGKLKGWWTTQKKKAMKTTPKATKKIPKAEVKQEPKTIMTATNEANKKKKQYYDNPYLQFLYKSRSGIAVAAGLIVLGVCIYKYSTYHDVRKIKPAFELNDDEEDFMDTIESGIKRIQRCKYYNLRQKKIKRLQTKIDEYLEDNGVSKRVILS